MNYKVLINVILGIFRTSVIIFGIFSSLLGGLCTLSRFDFKS